MNFLLFVCFFVLIATVLAEDYRGRGDFAGYTIVKPKTSGRIFDIDARDYRNSEIIPEAGVSKECLVLLDNWAYRVNQNWFKSLCPRMPFGALVVDFDDKSGSVKDSQGRSCGRILAINRGQKNPTDPSEHSEIDAIRRLAYARPGQRNNATLWQNLAIFTNGASCPMDTSAEILAGVKWQIYSLSIADLISLNWTQIDVEPEVLMRNSLGVSTKQMGLIRYANRVPNVARFAHRWIESNPCPAGCQRGAQNYCVDTTPYVLDSSMIIPDINIYSVPDDFQLVKMSTPTTKPTSAPTSAPTPTPTA